MSVKLVGKRKPYHPKDTDEVRCEAHGIVTTWGALDSTGVLRVRTSLLGILNPGRSHEPVRARTLNAEGGWLSVAATNSERELKMRESWGHISRYHPAKSQTFTEANMIRTESPDFDRLTEARQMLKEAKNDRDAIKRLTAALRMLLENIGGHQHWDRHGTSGANCPICQQQQEAATQAWEVLRNVESGK